MLLFWLNYLKSISLIFGEWPGSDYRLALSYGINNLLNLNNAAA